MCYHGNNHFTDERLSGFAPEINFVSLLQHLTTFFLIYLIFQAENLPFFNLI